MVTYVTFADASFTLVDKEGNKKTTKGEGLLLYNRGTVCDDGFTDHSANAICKEMGYQLMISWSYGLKWSNLQLGYSIKLDEVRCPSPSWSTCGYKTSNDCGHSEDVFLSCRCSIGFYRESDTCIQCPADTYNAADGIETSCTGCPGSSTSEPGSSYCSCGAGMFWNNLNCENCTHHFVSQEGAL